jgi:hypothetical protein
MGFRGDSGSNVADLAVESPDYGDVDPVLALAAHSRIMGDREVQELPRTINHWVGKAKTKNTRLEKIPKSRANSAAAQALRAELAAAQQQVEQRARKYMRLGGSEETLKKLLKGDLFQGLQQQLLS